MDEGRGIYSVAMFHTKDLELVVVPDLLFF